MGDQGYIIIRLDGVNYRAHRLAWFYTHGSWPEKDLDHKDLNRTNNKLRNLRKASRSQNMTNIKAHKDSTSGIKGVYFNKEKSKWVARINQYGKCIFHAYYENKEDARAACAEVRRELFGEFNRS